MLDPFFGTGTTGAVAKRLGRRWIGIEQHDNYVAAAKMRIEKVRPLAPGDLETATSKRAAPRVPFGAIIELGILEPGATLTDAKGRLKAEIRADGTLKLNGTQGSIHKLGAHAQGRQACNGWTYWHFKADGELKPIDVLRSEARRQLGLTSA